MATYYATFEFADVHPDGTSSQLVGYFDGISEATLDAITKDNSTLSKFAGISENQLELAIWQVKLESIDSFKPDFRALNNFVTWWQVKVIDVPGTDGITADFVSLVASEGQDIAQVRITNIEPVSNEISKRLEQFFSASAFKSAKAENISNALNVLIEADEPVHVAVYDMGQANCNALVDNNEHPRLFFDLGWPIQMNRHTAPTRKPKLFEWEEFGRSFGEFDVQAPVILSHWDWDHWAYVLKSWKYNHKTKVADIEWNDAALSRYWLVPRPTKEQKLGPSHWSLFMQLYRTRLHKKRVLNLWPRAVAEIAFNAGTVVRCLPRSAKPGDRNNSGLALFVGGKCSRHTEELILLPGDADFTSIPLLSTPRTGATTNPTSLVGLVASHHGGKVNVYSIPETKNPAAKIAISSGKGNIYGHPNAQVLVNYDYKGWKIVDATENRKKCNCLSHSSNSIVLQFSSANRKPKCECGAVPAGYLCLN